jgi:hypothetical protein
MIALYYEGVRFDKAKRIFHVDSNCPADFEGTENRRVTAYRSEGGSAAKLKCLRGLSRKAKMSEGLSRRTTLSQGVINKTTVTGKEVFSWNFGRASTYTMEK